MHIGEVAPSDRKSGGLTKAIATFAANLDWDTLPQDARLRARAHLVDTLGAIIAGLNETVTKVAIDIAGRDAEGYPLPAGLGTVSASSFAMICGTAAHGIELDDGYREGSVHPGAPVVPALLALAQRASREGRPFSGAELLTALVAGYEVVCAMAEAGQPALRERGFHPTSATGPLGAATACAKLMGLDAAGIENACGFAASACGGLFAFLEGGADVKRLHGGMAARSGYESALSARAGIVAPRDVIERSSGWAHAFTGRSVEASLYPARDLRILDCYMKPHACCRHLQPAFEATVELMREHSLRAEDVRKIEIDTYRISAHHAQVPWDSFATAQLSFPYLVYLATNYQDAGLQRFNDEHRNSPAVAEIASLLVVRESEEMQARYPAERPCRVTIETIDGRFTRDRAEASGTREEPISDEALKQKFLGLVAPALGQEAAERVLKAAWEIEKAADSSLLLQLAR